MNKHFFAYRKWQDGKPTAIQIEVIVAATVTRQEARRIADDEIAALRDGHEQTVHARLRTKIAGMEKNVRALPNYRFVGVN